MTSHMVTITNDVTLGSTESSISGGAGVGGISMNVTTERNFPLDDFPIHVTPGNNLTYYNVSFSRDVADLGHREGYYYSGDIYDLYKPWIHEPHFIPTVAVYGVTFLLGLVGNSLVIFAMLGDRKSRSVTASFMVSLAVADLLFLLVCVPYEIARNFTAHWYNGPVLCKLSGAVETLSALASVLNLIAVSVERYIVIVHPMKARSWCTVENTKKMLPCVWVIALGLSAPNLFIWDVEKLHYYNNETTVTIVLCDNGLVDDELLIYVMYQLLVMFVIPIFVLFFCYVFVIHALWISSRNLMQMTSHDSTYSTVSTVEEPGNNGAVTNDVAHAQSPCPQRHCHIRSRRSMLNKATREHSAEVFRARKQVIKMLIAIVMAFLLCWGPKLFLTVLMKLRYSWLYDPPAVNAKIVINLLPYVHSCINPVIYGFMSKSFRTRMKCACRAFVCRKSHPSAVMGKRLLSGSDLELDTRSTNGTVHTKISLRQGSSSHSDT